MVKLDLKYVRQQFPAFSSKTLASEFFFENAGGSYMCKQVIDRFQRYYEQRKVQPYYAFKASVDAGAEMDMARVRFAQYLNVSIDEVLFGPSTSQNTYVLSQAFLGRLSRGDTIIISEQEHEANSGVWRRLECNGIEIRIWPINEADGRLQISRLKPLLDQTVKMVAMTHCSNLVGEINSVRDAADLAHQVGAILLVDGVSYCPHGFPDVNALGADIYLFSTYKTYGPHQGIMVIRKSAWHLLEPQAHFFNHSNSSKWMVPAGPDHAQIAAANGIIDYFDDVDYHHGGSSDKERPRRVQKLLRETEKPNIQIMTEYLVGRKDIRLIGPSVANDRVPTFSFVAPHISAALIGKKTCRRWYYGRNRTFLRCTIICRDGSRS